ncbi:MAG TPA: DUF1499 domain-containing protein [Halomonas sp.]|nr:DUF1499 domain-containing protein [Halomonas sp.]
MDMRSASRLGTSDIGTNAARTQGFMEDLVRLWSQPGDCSPLCCLDSSRRNQGYNSGPS